MDSEYSTDETGKRKLKGAEASFERSKKTQRSHVKSQQDDDKLDLILEMMHEIKTNQKTIREEMQQISKQ